MTEPTPTQSPRGFWPLVLLQAQGAFNDNAIKTMLMLYAAWLFAAFPARISLWNGLVTGLIPVAFLTFSCWAGFIADKFSKRSVTLVIKSVELMIMILMMIVFWIGDRQGAPSQHILSMAVVVAFLLFTHSAFFSPSKYGIIPELVEEKRITYANGIIGLTTNLAIIVGTFSANELFERFKPNAALGHASHLHLLPVLLTVLSVVGLIMGLGIMRTPPANPNRSIDMNFFPELLRYWRILFADRTLALTAAGLAWFWGVGTILLTHMLVWGQGSLGLTEVQAGRMYMLVGLGIGLGSAIAGLISRNRIETGLIPLGSLGIALFALPLSFASPHNRLLMYGCVVMVAASAGMFAVPLNALLQSRTAKADRGGLLAANTYFSDSAMLFSAIFYIFLTGTLHLPPNMIFLIISLLTLGGTVIVLRLMPEALLRFVAFLLVRGLYRIRTIGLENLPKEGPALLVSNHISFIDALLIGTICPRPVRFMVWEGFYRSRVMRWLLSTTRCIPISSEQRPRDLLKSLRQAAAALKDGEVLCIFAEGQISRIGGLLPFQRGYEYIVKDAPAPVIPLYLHGVWGSIFSFEGGKFFWKWPRQFPYRARVAFGRPLSPETKPHELRQALLEAGAEAAMAAKPDLPLLHHELIKAARRYWSRTFMIDILSPPLTMGQTLWRSVILARRLAPLWGDQELVGVMLPPSVAGALVNYAAALSGRTTVNLNYTTGQDVLERCARKAGLKTVVTARPFLEKINLQAPAEAIYIEDYRGFHGFTEVILALLAARLLPARWLERVCKAIRKPTADTLATIIFSSGSTGEPKGVMLTHFNVASDVESIRQGLRIFPGDCLLGILPFFHSFGYTISLWLIPTVPVKVVHHISPLDAKLIGELSEKHQVSLVVATPTFLQNYIRRVNPAQFGSVRTVVSGAEKLTERVREAFLERFGVEPLQGYGTTECAPVVSVNVDNLRAPGFFQIGHKRGSIGHPLPGIAVKIVHPETGEPRGAGEPGLLLVKGGNVMQGYLGMPEKTAEVIKDGWYNTGDVAYIDEDGFIFITDRLSRFSKIGGEMVPHIRVEEKLCEALSLTEPSLVVTAVPDPVKGEQLVVLHTLEEETLNGIGPKLAELGLPNLWIPRREMFFKVEQIPILGTGKQDLQAIKKLALERAGKMGD